MIIAFASGKGLMGRFLSLRVCVWLGEISFALYMVHQILMKWFYLQYIESRMETASLVLVGSACLIASAFLHHCVENPARTILLRLKKHLGKRANIAKEAADPKMA